MFFEKWFIIKLLVFYENQVTNLKYYSIFRLLEIQTTRSNLMREHDVSHQTQQFIIYYFLVTGAVSQNTLKSSTLDMNAPKISLPDIVNANDAEVRYLNI